MATSTLAYWFLLGVFVRYLPHLVVACSSLIAVSPVMAASKTQAVRKVQLISMTGAPPIAELAPADLAAPAVENIEAAPLPAAFQVHDLSRRYVQFRMQQELIAAATPTGSDAVSSGAIVGVPIASSISVPAWMRTTSAVITPVAFRAGCAPLSYQPSGFLARSAEARRVAYYGMMSAIACEQGIPTGLFDAVIMRESGYNPIATSSANAFGLAQLMPGTAVGLGVDRYDPVQNLRGGARYLRQQLDRFGQVHLALAAYNAGPGRVRGGMVPRISETQAYVTNIIANWSRLTATPGSRSTMPTLPRGYVRAASLTQF